MTDLSLNIDLSRLAPEPTQFEDWVDEILDGFDAVPPETRAMMCNVAAAAFVHGVCAAGVEVRAQLQPHITPRPTDPDPFLTVTADGRIRVEMPEAA